MWSFGIVLHEIFTYGKEPYEGKKVPSFLIASIYHFFLVYNNPYVRRLVIQKREGDQPPPLRRDSHVPMKVYEMMTRCFKYEPEERPNFRELYDFFNMFYGEPLDKEKSVFGPCNQPSPLALQPKQPSPSPPVVPVPPPRLSKKSVLVIPTTKSEK